MSAKEFRLTVVIDDPQEKADFKLICALRGETMKEAVIGLIRKEITENKERLKRARL